MNLYRVHYWGEERGFPTRHYKDFEAQNKQDAIKKLKEMFNSSSTIIILYQIGARVFIDGEW